MSALPPTSEVAGAILSPELVGTPDPHPLTVGFPWWIGKQYEDPTHLLICPICHPTTSVETEERMESIHQLSVRLEHEKLKRWH